MKINIRTKLLLAFALIVVLSSAVNIYGLIQMNVLANFTTQIYNHPLQVTRAVLSANTGIIMMHRSMKDVAFAANTAEMEAAHLQVNQYEQEIDEQFAIVQKWILGDEGAALIAETIQIFKNWSPIREEVIALRKAGQRDKASAITTGKGAQQVALLNSKMEALKNYAANKASGMYESAQTTRTIAMTTSMITIITVIVLSGWLGFLISVGISKSVRMINTIANKIVAGEITSTITNRADINKVLACRDEMGDIGRAFYAVANSVKTVIDDIVQISQELAKGNLQIMPNATYQGDYAQIKNALETALPDQCQVIEDIIQIAQGLAKGDLGVEPKVEYQGDFVKVKTTLQKALSDLRRVIEDIVQVSQGLAKGQRVKTQVEYQGEFVQIKDILETASVTLAEATAQNQTQNWLKTGQTQLSEQMSGEQNLAQLAKNIISFLATYLEMPVGICYLLEEAKGEQKARLKLIASYAYTYRKGITSEFLVGEGSVGQAALEKKPIHITKVPEDYYVHIHSGLGKALPSNVIIQPFLYEGTLKGVIELAAFKTMTDIQLAFLTQVMPSIGVAVNTAESRSRVQKLLQQSRTQAKELQQTQTELQQQNEELQNQSEELQTQSEELQTQQEELTQTNEELEERTKALEQQQEDVRKKNVALEQTQTEMEKAKVAIETKAQELELASKYKSEFLANMSHELRTPLNSLLILAQLLSDNKTGNLSDKQIKYAKTIHSAGSDLLTLINEILDLSKVEAGKIEVHVDEVSLPDLVETVEHKFRHVAEDKGLAFHITVADDLPPVINTDVQRLRQIINNLLSNAFKFTSEGEIRLTMQRPSEDFPLALSQRGNNLLEPANTFAISVADTGVGIPKDKQKVIFEAFQQVDGTTSRRYGGTGLGLSISRQLARLLGGELQLQSEEGKGSTFTLYLPEIIPAKASIPQPKEVEPSGGGSTRVEPLGRRSVSKEPIVDDRDTLKPEDKSLLIIEDDRKFSIILMELAREKDFKCIVAEDGKTGLQFVKEYQPNAIVLDVGLPKIDGWLVMERLKENPNTRHIPVHFISAADDSLEAKKRGAIGYLHKPVNMAQLGEAFKKIEQFMTNTAKNLLVVVDIDLHKQQILALVEAENVQTMQVETIATALKHLQTATFNCIILDIEVEHGSGIKLLEQMKTEEKLCQTPLIIYAEREFSKVEEELLLQYEDNLTIKTVNSLERLLDETTLFLHQIEADLSTDKRNMIRMVHDKTAILKNKKVLIIDDDMRNVYALATVLEEHDMDIICGTNGKEGLEQLEKQDDIAIVLMDIMMPEMDGYEAMQEIRKQPRFHKLPIIALTAKAMKGDKAKCIKAGASDYLAKPVDIEKLISLMRVWLYR